METTSTQQIIITGGHSGIGLELTKRLVAEGHRVGLVVRNKSRLEGLPEEVRTRVEPFEADLSKQADVLAAAQAIRGSWRHVDVLYNNAGLLGDQLRMSPQDNELQLEINTVAPYLMTLALKPALDAAEAPIVVNTATEGMATQSIDMGHLFDVKKFRRLFGGYLHSKAAMVQLMADLAARPEWAKVRIRSVNPGANKTGMTNGGTGMPWFLRPVGRFLFSAPTKGGNLLYQGAFDPTHGEATGVYLHNNQVRPMKVRLADADRTRLLGAVRVEWP